MSFRLVIAAMALVLGSTACSVATKVTLTVGPSGRGTVAVTVTLDRAAVAAVGGVARLRSQLAVGDLEAAGWVVTGPTAFASQSSGPAAQKADSGGAVVSLSHGFSGLAQAQSLISDVAGPGVFHVKLDSHRNFWHTTFHLTGAVDLTCGINCFGDGGLKSATGSPVGIDPGALAADSGQTPGSVFTFQFDGRLPGQVHAGPGGTVRPGDSVLWTPVLGRKVVLSASSQSVNRSAIEKVGAGVAAVLLALASYVLWRIGRWVRQRLKPKHTPQHRRQGKSETVTPPS